LPKAASGEKSIPTQLNITLTVDGKIILNGQIATEENVKEKSIQELSKDAEVQAVISADKDVPHGKVVSIIDVVKTAGVKKFAITIEQTK
jgi:biopolymer transport protein ExbD